ncbi:AAT family amino acid transporter [Aureobasidium pullulans]|nr:AAT family amino acid transporter [Aureobasidium pullulans]
MRMIAIGSNIGISLSIGTGAALRHGGPAAVVIAFSIISVALYLMMAALAEMAIHYPVSGSFVSYASRFVDPALGFAVGWQYWGCWIAVFATEASAFSVILQYWGSDLPVAGAIAIFCAVTCIINFLPVRAFGEAEFVTSSVKIVSVLGFIIAALVLIGGGGSAGHRYDGSYWVDPGSFTQGFHGMAAVFVTAAFAAGGTEIVGVIGGESASPRHNIPRATRTVWARIFVSYVVTVTLVTILVPSDDPNLLGGTNVNASPLVIAVKRAGIKTLPDILNAIILICVMSVGTSSLYAASRMLMYLSSVKMAPKIFSRTDRAGRPITALLLTSVVGIGLSFLNVSNTGAVVFGWFSSLSGTAFFIFWLDIFLCNWRWRAAQKAQGVNMIGERFAYTQWGYPYAPIAGFILVFFMLVCNGYTSIWPLAGSPNATNFFANYLGVPVFIAMWAGWKLWNRTWWLCIKSSDVDLEVDRRYLSDHPEEEKFLEDYATLPKWKRFLSYVNF